MSDPKVYTAQRFTVAEPGQGRSACSVVALSLAADGTFALLVASYTSDWGIKTERSTNLTGSYDTVPDGIVCSATRRTTRARGEDRDSGDREDVGTDEAVEERIAFKARQSGLVCPIDHANLAGVVMSPHLPPHPGPF